MVGIVAGRQKTEGDVGVEHARHLPGRVDAEGIGIEDDGDHHLGS